MVFMFTKFYFNLSKNKKNQQQKYSTNLVYNFYEEQTEQLNNPATNQAISSIFKFTPNILGSCNQTTAESDELKSNPCCSHAVLSVIPISQ